ncbi:hypothetical protein MKZ38_002661 [Zalerion maritima]|uniref:Uncharacterized protein n=1 Tax=Zalerion maritima TaxID=339359 RepID=A0AAD5RPN7_9PEZI|nr:hypothetical protein MKZ38_002661 [Zalerion maritima]
MFVVNVALDVGLCFGPETPEKVVPQSMPTTMLGLDMASSDCSRNTGDNSDGFSMTGRRGRASQDHARSMLDAGELKSLTRNGED